MGNTKCKLGPNNQLISRKIRYLVQNKCKIKSVLVQNKCNSGTKNMQGEKKTCMAKQTWFQDLAVVLYN